MLITEATLRDAHRCCYSYGPGVVIPSSWREQWAAIFRAVAFAMHIEQHGACTCGCKVRDCDYCAHECADDIIEG